MLNKILRTGSNMLTICLIFYLNEPVYAYKRYAYKKRPASDSLRLHIYWIYRLFGGGYCKREVKYAIFNTMSFVPNVTIPQKPEFWV